ncbi:MAG TPA: cytochrome c [Caulobacteraceae bacterium]|nr:cytochrome c [Caulobacteraceae bacterium]
MTGRPIFLAALAAATLSAVTAHADGAAAYKRCAVCHLANGQGVPGAYPPLAGRVADLAATPAGRAYLVLVPAKGVGGPMQVNGTTYRGFMPQQAGLAASDLADLLNYAGQTLGGSSAKGFKPFAPAEVDRILKQHASAQPADVAALRPKPATVAARR